MKDTVHTFLFNTPSSPLVLTVVMLELLTFMETRLQGVGAVLQPVMFHRGFSYSMQDVCRLL